MAKWKIKQQIQNEVKPFHWMANRISVVLFIRFCLCHVWRVAFICVICAFSCAYMWWWILLYDFELDGVNKNLAFDRNASKWSQRTFFRHKSLLATICFVFFFFFFFSHRLFLPLLVFHSIRVLALTLKANFEFLSLFFFFFDARQNACKHSCKWFLRLPIITHVQYTSSKNERQTYSLNEYKWKKGSTALYIFNMTSDETAFL